jgi:hypothetical protein
MTMTTTDPALWTTRPVFGVAGGPLEVVLTDEGSERAFSIGAQVRRGPPALALEALATAGGEAPILVHSGAKLLLTDLGRRYDQTVWGHLRALGYVEGAGPDGVRLTDRGRAACQAGELERASLLARCRREAL